MHIVFHPGVHHTDGDRLMKCLLSNKEGFCKKGVAVPGPSRYRTLFREAFDALKHAPAAPDSRNVLLDAILDEEQAARLILSNVHFFGSARFALGDGQLYPLAGERVAQLRQLLPTGQIEIFMAIRNPASFLPVTFPGITQTELDNRLAGRDPRELRWSETMARIHRAAPDVAITVWCHEDMPLIWAAIITEMAGLPEHEKINGAYDLLSQIISARGMKRFRAHLQQHPNLDIGRERTAIADMLDAYALEDQVEEDLNLSGWNDALVAEMTEIYEHDMIRLRETPNLRMITP
ncbi:hypothetical protein [Pontibaca salina]|uniref:Uncharacterized protein n=1 Tax=Pontibaca salina TaxID=2795731 RepID=A0A934M2H1_9RHOB|nr:hypothetical protein [Pontibaca salina]MBI6628814.1 hypothetical protein [Pontibaca salina]